MIEVDEAGAVLGDVRQPAAAVTFSALRVAVTAVRERTPTAIFLVRRQRARTAGTLQRVIASLRGPDVPYVVGAVDEAGDLIRVSDTIPSGLAPPRAARRHVVVTVTATRLVVRGPDASELGAASLDDPRGVSAALDRAASCEDCARTADLQIASDLDVPPSGARTR